MNFIEFYIRYKPFRKVFNKSLNKWEYIESDTNEYCSSSSPGFMDIRLLKEGKKEIVWGIPGIFKVKEGNEFKTHFPTLIYPNPFGAIYEVDRAFEKMPFDEILDIIEKVK